MSCNGSNPPPPTDMKRIKPSDRRLDVQEDRDKTDTSALILNDTTSLRHITETRSTKTTKPQTTLNIHEKTFSLQVQVHTAYTSKNKAQRRDQIYV